MLTWYYFIEILFCYFRCVTGMYASMGLDMFLVKPTVGFYGLAKLDHPIHTEVSYDMDNNKVEMKNTLNHALVLDYFIF